MAGPEAGWDGLSVIEARRSELTFRPVWLDLAEVTPDAGCSFSRDAAARMAASRAVLGCLCDGMRSRDRRPQRAIAHRPAIGASLAHGRDERCLDGGQVGNT